MDGDTDALRRMMDITSDTRRSYEEKLAALLRLGCEYLGVEAGFLTEIDDGRQLIVSAVGDHELLQTGESCPLSESYCRKTIEQAESLTVQHAAIEGWEQDPAYETFGLESYVGARVEVDGDLYGTFCFADEAPRDDPFDESEVVFVELMADWVSHELARQAVTRDLQRERDRLEEFASVVSHDLRNPLSVASGELALERSARDDESEHLERAATALGRMDTLLGNLLDLSKAGAELGDQEPVSLADVATRSWNTVETGDAVLDLETTMTVSGDPVRLAQLFENLFRNSVEHGSTGSQNAERSGDAVEHGSTSPRSQAHEDAVEHAGEGVTVTVRATDDGFAVDDDGPGIPPAERPAVTAAGYTNSPDGNGFGLHIVEQIAGAHGWRFEVTESPEGGARFAFTDVDTVDASTESVGAATD